MTEIESIDKTVIPIDHNLKYDPREIENAWSEAKTKAHKKLWQLAKRRHWHGWDHALNELKNCGAPLDEVSYSLIIHLTLLSPIAEKESVWNILEEMKNAHVHPSLIRLNHRLCAIWLELDSLNCRPSEENWRKILRFAWFASFFVRGRRQRAISRRNAELHNTHGIPYSELPSIHSLEALWGMGFDPLLDHTMNEQFLGLKDGILKGDSNRLSRLFKLPEVLAEHIASQGDIEHPWLKKTSIEGQTSSKKNYLLSSSLSNFELEEENSSATQNRKSNEGLDLYSQTSFNSYGKGSYFLRKGMLIEESPSALAALKKSEETTLLGYKEIARREGIERAKARREGRRMFALEEMNNQEYNYKDVRSDSSSGSSMDGVDTELNINNNLPSYSGKKRFVMREGKIEESVNDDDNDAWVKKKRLEDANAKVFDEYEDSHKGLTFRMQMIAQLRAMDAAERQASNQSTEGGSNSIERKPSIVAELEKIQREKEERRKKSEMERLGRHNPALRRKLEREEKLMREVEARHNEQLLIQQKMLPPQIEGKTSATRRDKQTQRLSTSVRSPISVDVKPNVKSTYDNLLAELSSVQAEQFEKNQYVMEKGWQVSRSNSSSVGGRGVRNFNRRSRQ